MCSQLASSLISDANNWVKIQAAIDHNDTLQFPPVPRPLIRFGMWPIISFEDPELAIGLGLILASLLETWKSTCVYRLLARGEDTIQDWHIQDSQFNVDDWELDGLDENGAIWGELKHTKAGFDLRLEIEFDDTALDEVLVIEHSAAGIHDIVAFLPNISASIMTWVDSSRTKSEVVIAQTQVSLADEHISRYLNCLFFWELEYYLSLRNQRMSDNLEQRLINLMDATMSAGNGILEWTSTQSVTRLMVSKYVDWSAKVQDSLDRAFLEKIAGHSNNAYWPAALLIADRQLKSFDLLEELLLVNSHNVTGWRILGGLYYRYRDYYGSIDAYQRAIELGVKNSAIYAHYAEVLTVASGQQLELKLGVTRISASGRPHIERLVLQKTESYDIEAIAAYESALALDPNNIELLSQLIMLVAKVGEFDSKWDWFRSLLRADVTGDFTKNIINSLDVESYSKNLLRIIREAIAENPSMISLRMNLIRLFLLLEFSDSAKKELELLEKMRLDGDNRDAVCELRILLDDPDFEYKISEIRSDLASHHIATEHLDYLEAIARETPEYAGIHQLLAQAYNVLGESEDALEVLLDQQRNLGENEELFGLLAHTLWILGENKMALDYLKKGLAKFPYSASLIALQSRFLFDQGNTTQSRNALIRAENIDIFNHEIAYTRTYIAKSIANNK